MNLDRFNKGVNCTLQGGLFIFIALIAVPRLHLGQASVLNSARATFLQRKREKRHPKKISL
jgi:hypothetical protein